MPARLEALHQRIEDLTDPDGEYAVVCPRSGKRPVPVRGKSFPSPDVVGEAVDLVVEYRRLLREVDPHLESIPIVACEETAAPLALTAADERQATERESRERDPTRSYERAEVRANGRDSAGTVTLSGDGDEEWLRMTGAPVVRVREDGEPLDDAVVGLDLNSKL